MRKDIKEYKLGEIICWKSHEGIKGNGYGKVIDIWTIKDGVGCITARNCNETVSLGQQDLY